MEMKVLIGQVFLLLVFFTRGLQTELSPDAENVCLESETYDDTIQVKVKKPYVENVSRSCWRLTKLFSCKKQVKKWKEVTETKVVQRSRIVPRCCNGYKEEQENGSQCVPACPKGCVNGMCKAPDVCACFSGFQGSDCSLASDINIGITTKSKTTFGEVNTNTENGKITSVVTEKVTETDTSIQTTMFTIPTSVPSEKTVFKETSNSIIPTENVTDQTLTNQPDNLKFEREYSKMPTKTENIHETESTEGTTAIVKSDNKDKPFESYFSNIAQDFFTEGTITDDNTNSEFASTSESAILKGKTLWINFEEKKKEVENDPDNDFMYSNRTFRLTPGLCIQFTVCVLVFVGAAWWAITKRQKRVRRCRVEKQSAFHEEERKRFHGENVLLDNVSEMEMGDSRPVLKTFKPLTKL